MTRIHFSVRSLLIAVVVFALPLGWVAMRINVGREKARAVADLRAMGVSIVMDGYQTRSPTFSPWVREMFGWQSIGIALNVNSDDAVSKLNGMLNLETLWIGGGATDSGMMHLESLPSLRKLTITTPSVTDEGLRFIAHTVGFEELNLEGTGVTAAGLLHLKHLRNLNTLTISGTEITHADVVRLFLEQGRGLPDALVATGQLTQQSDESEPFELHLEGEQIADDLIEFLVQMPRLRSIGLKSTAVTDAIGDEDLVVILQVPSLQELSLGATQLEGDGLRHLSELTKLRHLHLGNSDITDQGLMHLSRLPSLRELWLDFTSVSDAGATYLKELTALRKLGLVHTHVTQAGFAELAEALPECEIVGRLPGRP